LRPRARRQRSDWTAWCCAAVKGEVMQAKACTR
jgi:hypothetical protein